jgi:uncharacterized protein YegL
VADQLPFAADVGLAMSPEPRCACVLLVDVSGSMNEVVLGDSQDLGYNVQQDGNSYRAVSGGTTKIELVNQGIQAYQAEVTSDSLAAQRVEVSVITFGGTVQTVVPFVTAKEFTPPMLTAQGETPMGAAILHAIDAVNSRKQQYKQNSIDYYRPWIFLITDGVPTDSWTLAAEKVREGEKNKNFAFYAVGVGDTAIAKLQEISVRKPLPLKGYSFREMFKWLAATHKSVSKSTPGEDGQLSIPSPAGWATLD